MRVAEYVHHDAVGLAQLVADGEVTVAELQTAALKAAQAVNPQINAVVETWPADDGPRPAGAPLAGVPFLIKDIGAAMAGRRMELGSRLAAGNVARADSALMLRVRRAGLVTFGRTATSEMAYSITTEPVLYGATRNPWDPERSAGGSSGGAGAAVAAGVVPLAHGTDAAGSLRVPAAYNGLFGLKPSRGRVSLGPDFDELFSGLAVAGSVSRTVRDSAALLDQISGPEPGDPYFARQPSRPYAEEVTRHPGRLRIGVLTQAWGGRRTTAPVADALSRTVALLESLGHRVEEVEAGLGVGWEEYVLANARL
ncbi:MAG: amidase, partial [Streptomyces albidoflavus]